MFGPVCAKQVLMGRIIQCQILVVVNSQSFLSRTDSNVCDEKRMATVIDVGSSEGKCNIMYVFTDLTVSIR